MQVPACRAVACPRLAELVLLAQVAGLLLKKYAEKFKGAPLQATYAYLRSWATDNLPANPLVSHETKVSHLRDAALPVARPQVSSRA